jgi:hypothetical protein
VSGQGLWVGRGYLHFVLPVPTLAENEIVELDHTIGQRDGWTPVAVAESGPLLSRAWETPGKAELRLALLSWYPAFATLGPPGRSGRAVRAARDRVADLVLRLGGFLVGDTELAGLHARLADRWAAAASLQREIDRLQLSLEQRQCPQCGGLAGRRASHCANCGRRYADIDDTTRDERHRQTTLALRDRIAELAGLARGEGIFPHWPAATEEPVVEVAGPVQRPAPRVVPHR